MPSKTKKRSSKSRQSTKKTGRSSAKKKGTAATQATKDSDRFVKDLLIRGEAAIPTADGDLPPGATHRIVDEDEGTVERERFSIC